MSKLVVLDAGHGGHDPGAVNGTRYEKDDVLRLALAVQPLLAAQGVRVQLNRSSDVFVAINTRAQLANSAGADLFVSLHRNSHTTAGANGVELFVQTNANSAALSAATIVLEHIAAVGIQSNRGVKRSGAYGVLNGTTMPAMLVELGFLSNVEDNRLFDAEFQAYAAAIAQGICAALDVPYHATGAVELLHRVQVGAFAVYANAQGFVKQVKDQGLDAFLVEVEDRGLWRVQVGAFRERANAEAFCKKVRGMDLEAFVVAA